MAVLERAELDERDEALQQALDFIQQSAKRWHERLTLNNLRFAERYVKAELELLILLKGTGVGAEQFGARLHRTPVGGSDENHRDWQVLCPVRQPANSCGDVKAQPFITGDGRDEQAMLIDDVQSIDEPEVFAVPSSIRLERANRLEELLGGGWHLSLRRGLEFPRRRDAIPAPDGKGHPCDVRRIGVGGVGEMVEAGSDVVNRIAEDERDGYRNRGDFIPDLGDSPSGLRVILGDDWIGIGPTEGVDLCFEVVDVLVRTIQLQPDALKAGYALPSLHGCGQAGTHAEDTAGA